LHLLISAVAKRLGCDRPSRLSNSINIISMRAGITEKLRRSNKHARGTAHRHFPKVIKQESYMSDATRLEPALDHLGPPVADRVARLAGVSTTEAAPPAYTMTARILHWIMAVLILFMIPLGIVIANDWGGPVQESLYDLHRSVGALIMPLALLRLIWRLANPPASLPASIPLIHRFAAHATHGCLYVLLITQPIVGWIATSAYRAPITVFGWFELPPIWPEDRLFSDRMFAIHGLLGTVIAGLAAAHVGAALFHHFVRKDRVLMRMITG
jgi:cytochrome b561